MTQSLRDKPEMPTCTTTTSGKVKSMSNPPRTKINSKIAWKYAQNSVCVIPGDKMLLLLKWVNDCVKHLSHMHHGLIWTSGLSQTDGSRGGEWRLQCVLKSSSRDATQAHAGASPSSSKGNEIVIWFSFLFFPPSFPLKQPRSLASCAAAPSPDLSLLFLSSSV